jgi:hypothetical protein
MKVIRRHYDVSEVQVNIKLPTAYIRYLEQRYTTIDNWTQSVLNTWFLNLYTTVRYFHHLPLSTDELRPIVSRFIAETITPWRQDNHPST